MERLRIRFLFRRLIRVRWAGDPQQPYVVWQQRHTVRDTLGPVVEYGIAPESVEPPPLLTWAYEPDLTRWED